MKTIPIINLKIAIVLLISLCFLGCKKSELMTFSAERNLFFEIRDTKDPEDPSYDATINTDSLRLSFALMPDDQMDAEIKIPIKLIGPQLEQARSYSLIMEDTDLQEGVDFKWMTDLVFPAGKSVDTIRIKVFRKEKMQAKTFKLFFRLQENEHFGIRMQGAVDRYRSTAIRCFVNDIMSPPTGYVSTPENRGADYYLGTFSKKKLQVITLAFNEAYGEELSEDMVYGYMVAYADMFGEELYLYLEKEKAEGNTIYEADGQEMTAGEYYQ